MKAVYIMRPDRFYDVYSDEDRKQISKLVEIEDKVYSSEETLKNIDKFKDVEIIFSGWGAPIMDNEFLNSLPELKAVFYGAGSVRYFVTDAFWNRKVVLSSAWAANAVPVSEFAFSQILLSLKQFWYYTQQAKKIKDFDRNKKIAGAYKSNVGIISLGMIGKMVCEKLKMLDVNVFAYDPFASEETAKEYNVTLCSLDEIFKNCDVISLHAPWLKETENMITSEHFSSMKPNSTFINTARGAIVNEKALIDVFQKRDDIYALLDVTYPEPPHKDSPLYTMENVLLTPHIAGSLDKECTRMGHYMLNELKLYLNNKPLNYSVTEESVKNMA